MHAPLRRTPAALVLTILVLSSRPAAAAPPVFEPELLLSPLSVDTGVNDDPSLRRPVALVRGGTGTWIGVWSGDDRLAGGGDDDLWYSRSTDGGLSFSTPQFLNSNATTNPPDNGFPTVDEDDDAMLAGDASGTWIAVWEFTTALNDFVALSRSTDDGVTWSVRGLLFERSVQPSVATDGAGTWVVVWEQQAAIGPGEHDLMFTRSADGGVHWSPPASLNSEAASDSRSDVSPRVYFAAGVWIVAWQAGLTHEGETDIVYTRSLDGGATWSAQAELNGVGDVRNDFEPMLASDGAGNWVAVWSAEDASGGLGFGTDWDVLTARSSDGGATWTAPALLNANAGADGSYDDVAPSVAAGPAGSYLVAWRRSDSSGLDRREIVASAFSEDGGASWSTPATINVSETWVEGNLDLDPTVLYDPAGHWAATWWTTDPPGGHLPFKSHSRIVMALAGHPCGNGTLDAGEACDDGARSPADCCGRTCQLVAADTPCLRDADICTLDRCDGAGTCEHVFEPRPSCRAPIGRNKSTLVIRTSSDPTKNKAKWRWQGETSGSEFGTPIESYVPTPIPRTDYALCVYGSPPGLVLRAEAPGGGTCGPAGDLCWSNEKGFITYEDADLTPSGVSRIVLRTSKRPGASKLAVDVRGANLTPPSLPIGNPPVTAQLLTSDQGCWEAHYSTRLKNVEGLLSGKSD